MIDHWGDAGTDSAMAPFAGKPRALKVELRDGGDAARCILKWAQKSGFAEQVIPPEAFWQDHGSGPKAFAPLPYPPYPATFTPIPGRQVQVMEDDQP